jgi:hypothetical protein
MKCEENLEKKLENTLFDKISKVHFHFFPFQVVISNILLYFCSKITEKYPLYIF